MVCLSRSKSLHSQYDDVQVHDVMSTKQWFMQFVCRPQLNSTSG